MAPGTVTLIRMIRSSLITFLLAAFLLFAATLGAHPMGNLSINHYARLEPGAKGVNITYVLDLAEIPTFELTQTWNTPAGTEKTVLDRKAAIEVREWVSNLVITVDGNSVKPTIDSTTLTIIDGAGNLPVFHISSGLHVQAGQGRLGYEDRNFTTRAGWREIVVRAGNGAQVVKTSAGKQEISQELTAYPQDPTKAPPQETKAWLEWKSAPAPIQVSKAEPAPPVVAAKADVRPPEAAAMGTVKRNDSISKILRMKTISWPLMALLIGLAFWFGALHALEPGHGKTMVAAYLVGEKGTAKHAVFLGSMVTFTHTISVFALGIATIFLSRYIMPEKISKVLGILSGLSIAWIGGVMLWRRAKTVLNARPDHSHPHTHPHSHSMGSLIALGASGGLVPCPSALILLLSAISIGRPGLGVILLIAFSLGLAIVLTGTGILVVYAKNLLPVDKRTNNMVFSYMPVVSAAAIFIIGIVMTKMSLG
jgi:nickel/cobalt exporter